MNLNKHSGSLIRAIATEAAIYEARIDRHALDVIACALRAAEEEIHHPGAAVHGNYDVLDLIDQAKSLVNQAKVGESTKGIPG
jgi:hypothetical protein